MYKFANKTNVKTSQVSFKHCPDLVDHGSKPRLVSSMVTEYSKTGQLPNSCPLRRLETETDDIDSFSPEYGGSDKIDSFNDVQHMMDRIENLESEKKSRTAKLKEEISKMKLAERKKLLDELKKNSSDTQKTE